MWTFLLLPLWYNLRAQTSLCLLCQGYGQSLSSLSWLLGGHLTAPLPVSGWES